MTNCILLFLGWG